MANAQSLNLWRELLHPPPPKTNMTMEHPPFEDVFPCISYIENGDFPTPC